MINQSYQQLSDLRRAHVEFEREQYSDRKKAEYQAKKAKKRLADAVFGAVVTGYRGANK